MRHILTGFFLLGLATSADAGAWNREKGQLFVSSGLNLWASDWGYVPNYYDTTIYGEYGLTDRVTLGFDYFTADRDNSHTAVGFAQFPLGDVTGANRYAASLGFGLERDQDDDIDYLMRGGLSWGRGLQSGWLGIDASATTRTSDRTYRPKVDFTWGHNLSDAWTTMVQLQTGEGKDGTRFAKLNPTVIYSLTDNARVNLGLVEPITGPEESSLRIGVWFTL
ncbi:hypothetical protein [Yoonia sediminilitoris]|uniref:Uncharacterized protein n=1 Tax=Yoonia sediminilitoris TaxID=1286148 RepID=A0A2T6KPX2_9RHOB|nr:hypothetical protein [Yoonia sediminilitoris]PUB18602.1 hypothetical protein C8N45_101186 [Yoonia sediminilitoris]RCW98770.1 hypothetical protein DFP92_101186 [Yoonia sediminilitoris]